MKLQGKRVVITGSSSGIGRETALYFAAEGASVVINARGSGAAGTGAVDAVVDEIRSRGGKAIGVAGAVNDPAFAERLVDSCVDAFGGIDVLVNNAAIFGIESIGPVTECSVETWCQTVDINLNGVFYTCRRALQHMRRQRWGRIINTGSLAGTGALGGSAYPASKSALFGLTRAIAGDYGPYGITANCFNPEARTPMGDNDDDAVFAGMQRRWMERGFQNEVQARSRTETGRTDAIPPFLAYLCLDEADYLNGEVFALEGRRVAMLARPDEQRVLFRDYRNHGPWTLDELSRLAPIAFSVSNAWPRREGEALERWEKA